MIRNFGYQDHIGTSGNAGSERQPAGFMSHNLNNDDTVVTACRAVQPVDGFSSYTHGGVKSKSHVCSGHIVINGFWQCDDIQPLLCQMPCILLGSVATNA